MAEVAHRYPSSFFLPFPPFSSLFLFRSISRLYRNATVSGEKISFLSPPSILLGISDSIFFPTTSFEKEVSVRFSDDIYERFFLEGKFDEQFSLSFRFV